MGMARTQPEPFEEEHLCGAKQLQQRLVHILPPTFNTNFFLARWHRAYNGDFDEIERRLGELIAHRHALGYDRDDIVRCAGEHEFARKTFERFAISNLNVDVFSGDVAVFLQKMKGVDLKEIMKVIPLGHVLNSYYVLQECFHRAMHAHELRTGRPAAVAVVIDLDGLSIADFINPLSTPSKLARFVVKIWSDYFSENLVRLFLINPPAILSIMWQVAKQILDAKTQSRIVFLTKVDDLHDFLASEAIPIDYGGSRRDPTGFSETSESCISRAFPVKREDYFNEEAFWRRYGLSKPPPLVNATLKPKQGYVVDIDCTAGQILLWLFTTSSDITFEIVQLTPSPIIAWPRITLTTLKIPETGFLTCRETGTYQVRFVRPTTGWLLAPKVTYRICAVDKGSAE